MSAEQPYKINKRPKDDTSGDEDLSKKRNSTKKPKKVFEKYLNYSYYIQNKRIHRYSNSEPTKPS